MRSTCWLWALTMSVGVHIHIRRTLQDSQMCVHSRTKIRLSGRILILNTEKATKKPFYSQTEASVWLVESVIWPQSHRSCASLDEEQTIWENPLEVMTAAVQAWWSINREATALMMAVGHRHQPLTVTALLKLNLLTVFPVLFAGVQNQNKFEMWLL